MNDPVLNTYSVCSVAAGITGALGVPAPHSAAPANPALQQLTAGKAIDRVLMYNPDAIAMWLWQQYTPLFAPVLAHTALTLPLCTVMPSVTPVCFASMYTGAQPQVHGIRSYTKPVLQTDTVFDALIRAGKKPAIVSTQNDSISMIFLQRQMDYFIYPTVEQVNEKALELIAADNYDLLVVYNGNYDAAMHRYAPLGEPAMQALRENLQTFDTLARAVKQSWQQHNTLLGFAPDHGCHEIDGGLGSHGLDMPEDLNILHFYGVVPGAK